MTKEEIRILAENRIIRRKKFHRFLFIALLSNLLIWFIILENEPEAIGVAYTVTGISFGIMGILSKKTFGFPDVEKLKKSRRERKIQKEMVKVEEELERMDRFNYCHEERLRLKEPVMKYPESDFV